MKRSHRFYAFVALFAAVAVAGPVGAKTAPDMGFRKISTKAPAWYTHQLHAAAVAAGTKGVEVPAAASLAFLGIRPGQQLLINNADGALTLCTSNFVFGTKRNYAIGTAGHCGLAGDQVDMVFAPKVLVNIGVITKSTGDAGIGNDFALISIFPAYQKLVSPSMAFWGGPTGAYTKSAPPNIVKHIGWGLGIGAGGTPRVGVGTYYSSTRYYFVGVINLGDSGSAADSGDNKALGNITHISALIDEFGLHTAAGTSIARILQVAGLPLATCASPKPWPLYGCPKI